MWLALVGCAPDDPVGLGSSLAEDVSCGDAPGCVAAPAADASVLVAQAAIGPDGAAWLSWVDLVQPGVGWFRIARSPSPGVIEPAVAVPVAEVPIASSTEKPSLAVRGDRIAIAYSGYGVARHADAHAMYVQLATVAGGVPAFADPVQIDTSEGETSVMEDARVALAPDGEAWVFWKRQDWGISDYPTFARESDGYVPAEVNAELPHDHDCSPPDLRFGRATGQPLLSIRGNLSDHLQTLVLVGDDGGFARPVQVSDDDYPYNREICPTQGPRTDELPDGTLIAAWIAPGLDEVLRASTASSTDGGQTWSLAVVDHGEAEVSERWLAMTTTDEGGLLIAVEQPAGTTLYRRDAVGDPASPGPADEALALLSGVGDPLYQVELAAGAGRSVALGKDLATGRLWLVDL